jgi:glycosyltransferase involved in cell wall biosynthesis
MKRVLGYVTPVRAYSCGSNIYMQGASGRVAEELARRFDKVLVCTRVVHGEPPTPFDFALDATNLEIISQPYWEKTAGSLVHLFGIVRSYAQVCRRADVLFVRGMCPYIAALYACAAVFRKPICHWIVGDPVTLLRTSGRKGALLDTFGLLYAVLDRASTRLGRWLTNGTLLCNGRKLACTYKSPRTIEVVSSTIREDEFFTRYDTCRGPVVRILFVGFVRPEKGIEYLLDALWRLPRDVTWELEIVGPSDFPAYRRRLDDITAALGIAGRVRWSGYVPYGQPLFDRMRAADMLVLPTLSEGTPHVLVEARANGLPCISTTVGGVPSVVTHGHDALLVAPKDSQALARAIEKMICDEDLRRRLIRNGFAAARQQSLERFIATVLPQLETNLSPSGAALPQE